VKKIKRDYKELQEENQDNHKYMVIFSKLLKFMETCDKMYAVFKYF